MTQSSIVNCATRDLEGGWKYGGGGTVWDSMAYDSDLDLLYIGTGNASPWNYKIPNGEKLCIDSSAGRYVWNVRIL